MFSTGLRSSPVEFNFINHRLNGSDFYVGASVLGQQLVWHRIAHFEPPFLVQPKLIGGEFPTTRMPVVVAVNLSVAIEAHGDRVRDVIVNFSGLRLDVVGFDFHPTKVMADAASPMTTGKNLCDAASIKCHFCANPCLANY